MGQHPTGLRAGTSRIIHAFGLVFGDIGTSPIYTMTVIFLLFKPTRENVLGITSLIIWTLIIIVSIGYAWLAMNLNSGGEGGTIVLKELATKYLKKGRRYNLMVLFTYIGVSLLIGDGVITPAISILSAVEGIIIVPGLEGLPPGLLILTAMLITICLFAVQRSGTQKISSFFGPIMAIWFVTLTASGIAAIWQYPTILSAINPIHGVRLLLDNGLTGFILMSEVILCATGGEALYADMGHLGREPILHAWFIVFFALVANYLGQGSFVFTHPEAKNLLFEMVASQCSFLYIPFLMLSVVATVIASQALISGMFSIVYQGITTRMMPLMKIDYTSNEIKSQIYIGSVNWMLMICVLWVIAIFGESSKLASAYGLAVTGTMTITGIMLSLIYFFRKNYFKMLCAIGVTLVDAIFCAATMTKLNSGGYWSLLIASIPFFLMLTYVRGQRMLARTMKLTPFENFLPRYHAARLSRGRIQGTALYFIREMARIPPYIINNMCEHNILYEKNVFIIINTTNEPFGVHYLLSEPVAEGIQSLTIDRGYKEIVNVAHILMGLGIESTVIFYGVEEIITDRLFYRVFSVIKRNTPSFVKFYHLPLNKLHGVITRVEM